MPLPFDPYLDAGIRGHIVKIAQQNVHRLAGFDIDDLIQEGYCVYYHVRNCYVGRRPKRRPDGRHRRFLPRSNPDPVSVRHFMRLFQRSFNNRISTLARKQSRYCERLMCDLIPEAVTETRAWESLVPAEHEQATALTLLRSAPTELRQLFALMVDDVVRPYRKLGRSRRPRRETNNEYYARLLGLPSDTDVGAMVANHFLR